jgi:hypothetical protein
MTPTEMLGFFMRENEEELGNGSGGLGDGEVKLHNSRTGTSHRACRLSSGAITHLVKNSSEKFGELENSLYICTVINTQKPCQENLLKHRTNNSSVGESVVFL